MKKLIIFATCLVSTLLVNAQAPSFQWAKSMGGYYGYATGTSVIVDASGNVYTTGYFEGKVDFDPGAGVTYLTSSGLNDIFITKADVSGNFVWAKQMGGASEDRGNSIVVNSSGNIIITGTFSGTADFDPGIAVNNLVSAGFDDFFVSMLDASGNLSWVRNVGGTGYDVSNAIAIDATNSIYITGRFQGIVDFDPGPGISNLNSGSSTVFNVFILKLNFLGNFVFAKQMEGGSSDGKSITIDPSGNIYTTGGFFSSTDFDPGVGTYNLTIVGSTDIFISKLNASGNFLWAKQLGGTQTDEVNSIRTDASGNVYTAGSFLGTSDFDPGPAMFNLTSSGIYDFYISKLNASGNFQWANRIGGSSGDKLSSISTDATGNTYATGTFYGTVDFDPGAGIFNLTGPSTEMFVLKLNTSGAFAWAKKIGLTSVETPNSISLDATNNIYTTGSFNMGIADFDPGPGTYNLFSLGRYWFLSKLDAAGNFVWAKSTGAGVSVFPKSMTTDPAGNVYATGYFYGTVDFDPGPGVLNLSTSVNDVYGDVFVTKCDPAGNLIWAKRIGGFSQDYATTIAVDASGNVYTVGLFNDTVDFDPGPGIYNLVAWTFGTNTNIFISKLNSSGNFVWARPLNDAIYVNSITLDASGNIFTAGGSIPGTNSDEIHLNKLDPSGNITWSKSYGGPAFDAANSIAVDASGNIYVTGVFNGTSDFDPGPSVYNLIAAGNRDIFVSKLDGLGNFIWAKQMGGVDLDHVIKIAVDASGNVYTSGYFTNTGDFDPGPGTFNLSTTGSNNIFISKLNNSGNFIWAKQFECSNSEEVRSMFVDNTGNVYTTGVIYGTTDFDPGSGTYNLTSLGGADIFISKLNNLGDFIWAQQLGGTISEQAYSISLDGSGNIYTSGTFSKTVDFDLGPGIYNITSIGNPDLFIQKLSQCAPPSAAITPSGNTSICSPGSVTLNATTGVGLTYQWKKNGVSISGATSSSYVATTTGSYTCTLTNACGVVNSTAIQVTVSTSVPATPGSITTTGGIVKVCPGESRTYSVVAIAGVTYTWTPCAGSTITSGQNTNSVSVQYNAGFPASDTLRVIATNSCGSSAQRKLKISRNTPGTPGSIVGDYLGVCNLSGKPYSVTNVAGMTYAWSFNTGTATIVSGQGTSNITANYAAGFVSGILSVTAGNGCGTSAARVKTIYAKPATPVSITGATSVCLNQQDVPYSIAPLSNVTNYTWTGPTGSHISDGISTSAGTTLITTHASVTVDFATTAGSIKVRGNNACASGSYKSLAVAIVCREGEFSNAITETRIFPNPASTEFTLESDDTSNPFNVEVYDAYGRLVFSELNLNSGSQVKTNGWADGLYSVVVRKGEKITTLKLVIQQ